jgi:3-phytase
LGTDKQQGLAVYNLQGEQLQLLKSGRLNNVDVRQGVLIGGALTSVAVASNRTNISIDVFTIDDLGGVHHQGEQRLDLEDPYGICMFKTVRGQANVLVNDKDGRYQQWQLDSLKPVAMTLVREFTLTSQPEGCSVDEPTGQLFVGEENVGLWRLAADQAAAVELVSIDKVGAGALVADVEGVEVMRIDDETAYLITSSQGDNTYAVYDAQGAHKYFGSFQVVAQASVDGVSANLIDGTQETDGLTASAADFGGAFSKGILVIQDGYNRLPHERQNFKYVAWESVAAALGLKTR